MFSCHPVGGGAPSLPVTPERDLGVSKLSDTLGDRASVAKVQDPLHLVLRPSFLPFFLAARDLSGLAELCVCVPASRQPALGPPQDCLQGNGLIAAFHVCTFGAHSVILSDSSLVPFTSAWLSC